MIGLLSSSSRREKEECSVGCLKNRAGAGWPVFGDDNHDKAPMAQNPRNAAGQVRTIFRYDLNHRSSDCGLTIAILLECRRKRRVPLVALGHSPLIFGRIESIEPPDFLRSRERLHRKIGMWAPKFGAKAGGLLFDLTI